MKAKAHTEFLHDQLGSVAVGDEIELTEAQSLSVLDYIDIYETKVVRQVAVDPKPAKASK